MKLERLTEQNPGRITGKPEGILKLALMGPVFRVLVHNSESRRPKADRGVR